MYLGKSGIHTWPNKNQSIIVLEIMTNWGNSCKEREYLLEFENSSQIGGIMIVCLDRVMFLLLSVPASNQLLSLLFKKSIII